MQPALNGGSQTLLRFLDRQDIGVEEKLVIVSITHTQIRSVLETVS